MDMRELKALEIAARCRLTFKDGTWFVPSQSSPGEKYRVKLGDALSCNCEDYQLRREACKHVLAAQIVCARDHNGKQPIINADTAPKRRTYKQTWKLYNQSQQTEKHRFQVLLFDLCRGLPNPPQQGRGRKRITTADMVFASTLKVYTTVSSRRFACDLKDAYERGWLSHLMNSVSVCAYLESDELTPVFMDLIARSSLPLRAVETVFAPDSTGFSASRFVRWHDEKYGEERSGRDWVKAHAIVGVRTNVVTSVRIAGRDAGDCPMFKPLVEQTNENFIIKEVTADKAYLSRENLEQVESLGGMAFVPFKSNSVDSGEGIWSRMFHYYQFRREEFLRHYHQRSNAESAFSMVKAKFRDHVRSKTDVAMKNEVLCKFLAHNICVVHQSHIELGVEPVFWDDKHESPATLPFRQIPTAIESPGLS